MIDGAAKLLHQSSSILTVLDLSNDHAMVEVISKKGGGVGVIISA